MSGKVKKVIKKKTLKQKDVDRDGVVDAEDDLNTDGIADEIVLQDLEFVYDATGNRICKIVKPHLRSTDTGFPGLTSQDHWTYTYYVRDAQGSVLATYNRSFTHGTGSNYTDLYDLSELDIYGSSRVGMVKDADVSLSRAFTASIGTDNLFSSVSYASVTPPISCTTCPRSYSRTLGHKQYELSNHLGNVIATVSDKKLMVQHATTLTLVDHYMPDVLSANDYYAFGLNMPGRSFSGDGYRYGFNGKESDSEWDGGGNMYDYGFRIYNPRLGKFLSVDPLTRSYPMLTPYQFASNSPIANIDLDGLESTNSSTAASTTKTTPGLTYQWSPSAPMPSADIGQATMTYSGGSTAVQPAPPKLKLPQKKYRQSTQTQPQQRQFFIGPDLASPEMKRIGAEEHNRQEFISDGQKLDPFNFGGGDLGMGCSQSTIDAAVAAPSVLLTDATLFYLFSDLAIAGPVGEEAVHIVLGLQRINGVSGCLDDWAVITGGQSMRTWERRGLFNITEEQGFDAAFGQVMDKVVSSNGRVGFSLSGMDLQQAASQAGWDYARAFENNGITNWELNQILDNPAYLKQTTFYRNGVKMETDQVLKYLR